MENRVRRRDLLVSEEEMVSFYKNRLVGIYDLKTLQKLISKRSGDKFLRMKKEDLLAGLPDETELSLFPDKVRLGEQSFPCNYRFNPEKDDDGVTVKIPSKDAFAVPLESTEWVVPGLLREKITSLIKGLPKSYRKKLVPVASTVDVIINGIPKKGGSLITALSQFIYTRFGLDIPASAWAYHTLPNHLQMRIAHGNAVDGAFVEARCGSFHVISNPSGPVGWGPFNESHTWPPGFYDITLDTKPIVCNWTLAVVETSDKENVSAYLSEQVPVETTADQSIIVANWQKNW